MLGKESTPLITTHVIPRQDQKAHFLEWQAKMHATVALFPGFLSLEISISKEHPNEWIIIQRFVDSDSRLSWQSSKEREMLNEELKKIAATNSLIEEVTSFSNIREGVTEVLVTKVAIGKEREYKEWIANIHKVEARFPGFRGAYVQSPIEGKGGNWITLLQFDTAENLDKWLSSKERAEILEQSHSLISSLDYHRVISPFGGWFSSLMKQDNAPIPLWKQTMIILLVLFPIVMLEFKFLSPVTGSLNLSLATFIGNAISVSLVSWPMMPIAIWFLGWWLVPPKTKKQLWTIYGTFVVFLLYAIEVLIFWFIF